MGVTLGMSKLSRALTSRSCVTRATVSISQLSKTGQGNAALVQWAQNGEWGGLIRSLVDRQVRSRLFLFGAAVFYLNIHDEERYGDAR